MCESDEENDSEEDSEGWAGDADGEGGETPRLPRVRRGCGAQRLITDLHQLEPLRLCTYGCGATVWPEEGGVCCSKGKHILGHAFNPPVDPLYRELFELDHISK